MNVRYNLDWTSDAQESILLPSPWWIIVGTEIEQDECDVQSRLELESTREYPTSLMYLSTTIRTEIEQDECEVQSRLELESTREYPTSFSLMNHSWNWDWTRWMWGTI